jgi:hypothetical protein
MSTWSTKYGWLTPVAGSNYCVNRDDLVILNFTALLPRDIIYVPPYAATGCSRWWSLRRLLLPATCLIVTVFESDSSHCRSPPLRPSSTACPAHRRTTATLAPSNLVGTTTPRQPPLIRHPPASATFSLPPPRSTTLCRRRHRRRTSPRPGQAGPACRVTRWRPGDRWLIRVSDNLCSEKG